MVMASASDSTEDKSPATRTGEEYYAGFLRERDAIKRRRKWLREHTDKDATFEDALLDWSRNQRRKWFERTFGKKDAEGE